jgi:hypothetical protein
MAQENIFYRCNLHSLVCACYDCDSWLEILYEAELDESRYTGKEKFVYGLDNCDLVPFISGETSDSIYHISRAVMVDAILKQDFGAPAVIVPPATVIEYIYGALAKAEMLQKYLKIFDDLRKYSSGSCLREQITGIYTKIKDMLYTGPDILGLSRLGTMLSDGKLCTLDSLLSEKDMRAIANDPTKPTQEGFDLLASRRRWDHDNYSLSCAVDMANWDLFLAADHALGGKDLIWHLTTTGNLI